jgi:predicted transcriptional regulator
MQMARYKIKRSKISHVFISHLLYVEELMNRGAISEDEYNSKRKEILDKGNSALRNINEQIDSIFSNLELV